MSKLHGFDPLARAHALATMKTDNYNRRGMSGVGHVDLGNMFAPPSA